MASVRKFPDLDALSQAAAEELVTLSREAAAERGICHIALSGGSTPRRLFQILRSLPMPWPDIELWWGDERTVPPEHAQSNYRMAVEELIDPLGLTRVHRMHGEDIPDLAAAAYEHDMVMGIGDPPILDIALQGLGPDGHTASLFPHSPALSVTERWVVANPVDTPVAGGKTTRITLTAKALVAARHIRFLVAGADKAHALAAVLEGPRDPMQYPAQLVADGPDVVWYVDEAAAAQLRSPEGT
ncbi:MAG: 6-phosphogluconolactonase [Kofleriaceae bacterium]|nr:6-phosphogluconolactonase [Kofleriaceae bacterium]